MTREQVAERIRRLMALAAPNSRAAHEEARTAALKAVHLMHEHGLEPAQPSVIDLDEVAALSLRVIELEHRLAEQQAAHARDLQDRDRRWAIAVQMARDETRAECRRDGKKAASAAVNRERETQARSGGEARARRLDPVRRAEIAQAAAFARWTRWRERHGA